MYFKPDASDVSARAVALDFTRHLAASWSRRGGARVLGVYAIGSLAHGGFSRLYSDLDVALIMNDPDPSEIEEVRVMAGTLSPKLAAKLSLFWTDRRFASGRFPPLDCVDYLDHGITLAERERILPTRPSLEEIRSYLRGTPLREWVVFARYFSALEVLAAEDGKRFLRTLLYPARFIFSWMTGGVASNDEAVAFLAERAPGMLDIDLIQRALACRRLAGDPLPLFAAREGLLQQLAICQQLAM